MIDQKAVPARQFVTSFTVQFHFVVMERTHDVSFDLIGRFQSPDVFQRQNGVVCCPTLPFVSLSADVT
jgi:hypothetical protein